MNVFELPFSVRQKSMKKIIEQHKFLLILLLFLFVSIISIYPTELNGHIWSFLGMNSDGRFHIMRIEGLAESMRRGQFFPEVNMSLLGGFGYIANIFYADLWLYPVALMRLAGLTTAQSFVIFYIILNFCTFLTSFWSFKKVSQRIDKSLLFSFVYTLSTYRIYDMVRRLDIGETLALTFLPIVVLGIYEIFYGDDKQWLYLTLGMTAVIYAHALSPILITIFIFWVIIFRLRILIREPHRVQSLMMAAGVSMLLSLAYFLPMFEQLRHTEFKLTKAPLINVSQTGMRVSDIFVWSALNRLDIQNIGLVTLLTALAILVTVWRVKNQAVRDFAIIGEILLFMTTDIFPWKLFDKTPLNRIQFPWRFNMIITILFAIYLATDNLHFFSKTWQKTALILLTLSLTMGSEQLLVQHLPDGYNTYAKFNDLDVYSIGDGEEYLPKNANLAALQRAPHTPQIKSGTVELADFSQKGSKVTVAFQNAKDAKIDLPLIGYYGYSATKSTGKVSRLTMDDDNNGLATVTVQGKGIIRVDYQQTSIQKNSRLISLFSLFAVIILVSLKKRIKF